jgi:hypothetical protein
VASNHFFVDMAGWEGIEWPAFFVIILVYGTIYGLPLVIVGAILHTFVVKKMARQNQV